MGLLDLFELQLVWKQTLFSNESPQVKIRDQPQTLRKEFAEPRPQWSHVLALFNNRWIRWKLAYLHLSRSLAILTLTGSKFLFDLSAEKPSVT